MSYIDSYDHVLVGYMAGLPVYARSGTAFEARLRTFGSERAEHDVEGA